MYVCMYVCMYVRKVTEEHAELCHRKILEERVVQGDLALRIITIFGLVHLPESIFKWCLNSVVDTLPHNSNLMRWNNLLLTVAHYVHVSRLYPMFCMTVLSPYTNTAIPGGIIKC